MATTAETEGCDRRETGRNAEQEAVTKQAGGDSAMAGGAHEGGANSAALNGDSGGVMLRAIRSQQLLLQAGTAGLGIGINGTEHAHEGEEEEEEV